jgi:hemoglobin
MAPGIPPGKMQTAAATYGSLITRQKTRNHRTSGSIGKDLRMPHPRPGSPGLQVGIDDLVIRELVHAFYARVRDDEMLGPIFNTAIVNWEEHLAKLCDFWSSVTLMSGRYKGTPMTAHAALPDLTGEHFDRWLELFRATARERCLPDAASLFIDRAERIAQSLELGVALHRGQFLQIGGRLSACPLAPGPNLPGHARPE